MSLCAWARSISPAQLETWKIPFQNFLLESETSFMGRTYEFDEPRSQFSLNSISPSSILINYSLVSQSPPPSATEKASSIGTYSVEARPKERREATDATSTQLVLSQSTSSRNSHCVSQRNLVIDY